MTGEKRIRDQKPVRGDHDGIEVMAVYTDITAEPRRLEHRNAKPLGDDLRRRERELSAAPLRRIRSCQECDDFVPSGESCQHVCSERRRRGDGDFRHLRPHPATVGALLTEHDAGGRVLANNDAGPQRRQRLAAGVRRRAVDDQDAV